jgi:hypothetical protein
MMNWQWFREVVVKESMYYSGLFPEGLLRTTEPHKFITLWPDQNSNQFVIGEENDKYLHN